VAAGCGLFGSLTAAHAVSVNWKSVIDILSRIGDIDDHFGNDEVRHIATFTRWEYSSEDGVPPEWRPGVQKALTLPFYNNNVHKRIKRFLAKLDIMYPKPGYELSPKWRKQRSCNTPFDMADEFNKSILKDAGDCSRLAVKLDLFQWANRLIRSQYPKDNLAGVYLLSSLAQAHAHAEEWTLLVELLERAGALDADFGCEVIDTSATSLKAAYSHDGSLQRIPSEFHRRLIAALRLPFFERNFDKELYKKEMFARDRHLCADEQGELFAKKLLGSLPELQPAIDKVVNRWGGKCPGQERVSSLVLLPAIRKALRSYDDQFLLRFGRFFEELANEDWSFTDVYGDSIVDLIFGSTTRTKRLLPYIGTRTFDVLRASSIVE
jgi:hypothetical protein